MPRLRRAHENQAQVHPPAAGTRRAADLLDPEALMRIQNLQLRARAIVEGYLSGLHRSPYHGFSVEFTEYRPYSPGDDLRYLDWRLYARSDRYYLKRFEDETNLRCHLLVDFSRSMSYSSGDYTKADYARTLAATFSYFLATQRDAVGVMTFDERLGDYLPPRYRPGHLHRILVTLEREEGGQGTNLAEPLEQLARILHKRGLVVLISDLLAPLDQLERSLSYLCTRGHDVVIFRVLDPAELDFPFEDASLLYDLESSRELYVDPAEVRSDYRQRFSQHQRTLETICGQLGIAVHAAVTNQPLQQALLQFVQSRGQTRFQPRGRRVSGAAR